MCSLSLRLLNVGRGDCILLQFPDKSWAIIDCGIHHAGYTPHNQAAAFLSNQPPLDSPVRFILATHPHADHDGGIMQLLQLIGEQRAIHSLYYSGIERRSEGWGSNGDKEDGLWSFVDEARRRLERGKIRECKPLLAGTPILLEPPLKEVRLDVISPTENLVNAAQRCKRLSQARALANNISVVLVVTYAGVSVLLPGDIEQPECQQLLKKIAKNSPRVIKAPHHGGRGSIPPPEILVDAPIPRFILISAGSGSAGHPHADFLRTVRPSDTGWTIRCTGLADACSELQQPQASPIHPHSHLPESLRRSLLAVAGSRRMMPAARHFECCRNNCLVIHSDGQIDHAESGRRCDAGLANPV